MPMPRFTSIPALSSWAIRVAMTSCGSMVSTGVCDEIVDERRRRDHVIGRDDADRNDVLRADDDGLCRHRDHRIEVARRQRVAEIAHVVGEEGLYQREVGLDRDLE